MGGSPSPLLLRSARHSEQTFQIVSVCSQESMLEPQLDISTDDTKTKNTVLYASFVRYG